MEDRQQLELERDIAWRAYVEAARVLGMGMVLTADIPLNHPNAYEVAVAARTNWLRVTTLIDESITG